MVLQSCQNSIQVSLLERLEEPASQEAACCCGMTRGPSSLEKSLTTLKLEAIPGNLCSVSLGRPNGHLELPKAAWITSSHKLGLSRLSCWHLFSGEKNKINFVWQVITLTFQYIYHNDVSQSQSKTNQNYKCHPIFLTALVSYQWKSNHLSQSKAA